MKVFVTGATGFVGNHVVRQLVAEGHSVVGLCRTEESAQSLKSIGVEPFIGDVQDPKRLAAEANKSDAILHLAFNHDFSKYEESINVDVAVVEALHEATKGSGKRIVVTSVTLLLGETAPGETMDDSVHISTVTSDRPRIKVETAANNLVKNENANISVIRLPPFVYGHNGIGFAKSLIQIAQKNGVSYYIGDGSAKLTTVHVEDAARAYVLAATKAKPGQAYHVAGERCTYKELATAIGKLVGVEAKSISKAEAPKIFGDFHTYVFASNHEAVGSMIEKDLGWKTTNKPNILDDISNGSYTA